MSVEHLDRLGEIDAVLLDVRQPLRFIPLELHQPILASANRSGKMPWLGMP
jgi:hypothetical protein